MRDWATEAPPSPSRSLPQEGLDKVCNPKVPTSISRVEEPSDASLNSQERREIHGNMLKSFEELGINLPQAIVTKVTASPKGLTPMEKFLVVAHGVDVNTLRLGDMSDEVTCTTCQATAGSLEE